MMSFACVAVTPEGSKVGEFEACLKPLKESTPDPVTTEQFWNIFPEAFKAATTNPENPSDVMKRFVAWVRSLEGAPVFVSHPIALDGLWMDYYLKRFTDEHLLEGPWRKHRMFQATLCLMSLAVAFVTKSPLFYGSYPSQLLGETAHTHRAIDDARGYAHLLLHILRESRQITL
jgi:hypothetical protein